jgi:hypothetical protein
LLYLKRKYSLHVSIVFLKFLIVLAVCARFGKCFRTLENQPTQSLITLK